MIKMRCFINYDIVNSVINCDVLIFVENSKVFNSTKILYIK